MRDDYPTQKRGGIMNDIILVKNLSKSFKHICVLSDVNVGFEKNKIHGIIGRNGSGKTVLIKIMCGLLKPDTGSVVVAGERIGVDTDFPKNTGAIIETPGFLSHQSGFRNLEYLASLRGEIGRTEIIEAIKIVGLNPYDKKHVGKYSMGMKQRLGLAQAIMENPDILVLDEPMNGLDKDGVNGMRNLLLSFRAAGKTIIIVSHSSEDIVTLCDTVHEIDKGKLELINSVG